MRNEFQVRGEKIVPYALKSGCENYDDFLLKTLDLHNGKSLPAHLVPSSTYFLMARPYDKILGAINIRHRLNKDLLLCGGHIGYGISPGERRKGYAAKMLALALTKCRCLGIEKALVTCDKDNEASAKTIMNNGGILENEIHEDDGNIVQRYWIKL